jgi:LytS/YehU family sensor histidine kinase
LRVEWQVDDAALNAQAPALILQPLIENAVIHSISRRKEPGWLRITAQVAGQRLRICVENSRTPGDAGTPGSGLGLESIMSRLSIIHGADASLKIDATDPAVYSAKLDLPLSVARKDAA